MILMGVPLAPPSSITYGDRVEDQASTRHTGDRRAVWWCNCVSACMFALVYAAIGVFVLTHGHLHEDAYILFSYAQNLADGHGIVYFVGGPPTEGATDFLWLLMLASATYLGLSPGSSAVLLNSLGVALTSYAVTATANPRSFVSALGINIVTGMVILVSPPAQAGYGGFSTVLYASLILLHFTALVADGPSARIYSVWIALSIALFRPDGAVLLVAAVISAFVIVERHHWRRLLRHTAVCFMCGAAYFVARVAYFGELFPLPFYVKTNAAAVLPGLQPQIEWLSQNGCMLGVAVLFLMLRCSPQRLSWALFPSWALMGAFLFIQPSQNIALRFQNATFGVLLYLFVHAFLRAARRPTLISVVAGSILLMGVILPYLTGLRSELHNLLSKEYINYFPQHVRQFTSDETVSAVTEAGRFSFWVKGEKIDLVGLNSREIATGLDPYLALEARPPDVVFLHTVGTVDAPACSASYLEVSIQQLSRMRRENSIRWRYLRDPVLRAPGAALDWLTSQHERYRVYLVCYGGVLSHLYAVRQSGSVRPDSFLQALQVAHSEGGAIGYLASYQWVYRQAPTKNED